MKIKFIRFGNVYTDAVLLIFLIYFFGQSIWVFYNATVHQNDGMAEVYYQENILLNSGLRNDLSAYFSDNKQDIHKSTFYVAYKLSENEIVDKYATILKSRGWQQEDKTTYKKNKLLLVFKRAAKPNIYESKLAPEDILYEITISKSAAQ